MVSFHQSLRLAIERHPVTRKVLLGCGVASSALYVATDILASARYEGYRYRDQQISELMAVEAPTRHLMVALLTPYDLLVLALAAGVWTSSGQSRALRTTAVLLAAYAIVGFVGLLSAPMHARGAEASITHTDVRHIVTTVALVTFTLMFIGFGAAAFGRRFRWYSIGTVVLLIAGGTLAGLSGSRLAANQPTPWMGMAERVNIYAAMLWVAVLAVAVWRASGGVTSSAAPRSMSSSSAQEGTRCGATPARLSCVHNAG